ncbi:MAG TPA: hypothetical protein EYQ47_04260 [Cycloclasticus sp.]|nr:hypothetical protein [Cycloclasticus sp.]
MLFIETGGLPGRINDVLDQMLHVPLSADLQQEKTSKGVPISWIIAIAGVVATVLAYSFFSDAEERLSSNVIAKKEGITEPRAKELPASLGKLKPWVRGFVVVRGDLYTE